MPYPIYASDLTMFKCARALYNCAVNRDKKPAYDEDTLKRFDHYASLETVAFNSLKADGWNIIKPLDWKPGAKVPKDSQQLFVYKDGQDNHTMRGRIDLIASPPGVEIAGLYEVKTAGEHIYKQFNSIEDFIDSKYWWISGQLAQWGMYMYMSGKDYGGIIQLDRDSVVLNNGDIKADVKVHPCSILKSHEYYNERVDHFIHDVVVANIDLAWTGAMLNEPPDFCDDLAVCQNCWCKGTCCNPPVSNEGVSMDFMKTATGDQVSRMLELHPLKLEYDKLKKMIESPLKIGIQDHGLNEQGYIIGDGQFKAVAKVSPSKKYNIPDEVKKQYESPGTRVSITIEQI